MQSDSGASLSLWSDTTPERPSRPLTENIDVDACLVGAGIAGLTIGYLLAREGRSVAVIDDGPIGGGDTSRTSAHLACALDFRYVELENMHGAEGARRAADSHKAAIDRIEQIVADEKIDCGFARVDAYLFEPPDEKSDLLDRELEAATRAGLEVEIVDRAPIAGFDTGRALRFKRQAQFHPLRYMRALADAVERAGGRVFTETRADEIAGGDDAHVTTTKGHKITTRAIVVATNSPVNDMFAIHTKQAPYRTFVVGARVPKGSVEQALYWDTLDPYHYVRVQPGPGAESGDAYDTLLVGGEDHKTGQADDADERYARLEGWARERWPEISRVDYTWSGQVFEPVDGLAYIGPNPLDEPNVFVATGFSGNGLTYGTIAGILLTDLVCERENPWATLYDPSRTTLGAAGEYAKENLNVASTYVDWVTPGDVANEDDIPVGTGAVVRRGLSKVAAFRDESGKLHECSAVCPHLGCLVRWNGEEASWDCPCHGSRFDPYGRVLTGPSINDLAKITGSE